MTQVWTPFWMEKMMKNPRLDRNRVNTVPTTETTIDSVNSEYIFAETIEKISALESELARLKAQIAVYALSEIPNISTGTRTILQVL